MQLINILHPSERVTFREAVLQGLGRNQGLYFPLSFKSLDDVSGLLQESFVPRSTAVLEHLTGGEISTGTLQKVVSAAFNFPLSLQAIDDGTRALELFHGPSLAFVTAWGRVVVQVAVGK